MTQPQFSKEHLLDLFNHSNLKQTKPYIQKLIEEDSKVENIVVKTLKLCLGDNKASPQAQTTALYFYREMILYSMFDLLQTEEFPQSIHQALLSACLYRPQDNVEDRGKNFFKDKLKISEPNQQLQSLGNIYIGLALEMVQSLAFWYPIDYYTEENSRYKQYYDHLKGKNVKFPDIKKHKFMKEEKEKVKFMKNVAIWKENLDEMEADYQKEEQESKKQLPKKEQEHPKTIPVKDSGQNKNTDVAPVQAKNPEIKGTKVVKEKQNDKKVSKNESNANSKDKIDNKDKVGNRETSKDKVENREESKAKDGKKVIQKQSKEKNSSFQVLRNQLLQSKKPNTNDPKQKPNSPTDRNTDKKKSIKSEKPLEKKQIQNQLKQQIQQSKQTPIKLLEQPAHKLTNQGPSLDHLKKQVTKGESIDAPFILDDPAYQKQKIINNNVDHKKKDKVVVQRTQKHINSPQKREEEDQEALKRDYPQQDKNLMKMKRTEDHQSFQIPKSKRQKSLRKTQQRNISFENQYYENIGFLPFKNMPGGRQNRTLSHFRSEKRRAFKNQDLSFRAVQPVFSIIENAKLDCLIVPYIPEYFSPIQYKMHALMSQSLRLGYFSSSEPSKPFFQDDQLSARLIKTPEMYILSIQNTSQKPIEFGYSQRLQAKFGDEFSVQIKMKGYEKKKPEQLLYWKANPNQFIDIRFQFRSIDPNLRFLNLCLQIRNSVIPFYMPITLLDQGFINKVIDWEETLNFIELHGKLLKSNEIHLNSLPVQEQNSSRGIIGGSLLPAFFGCQNRQSRILGQMNYRLDIDYNTSVNIIFFVKQSRHNAHEIHALYDRRQDQNQDYAKVLIELLCLLLSGRIKQ